MRARPSSYLRLTYQEVKRLSPHRLLVRRITLCDCVSRFTGHRITSSFDENLPAASPIPALKGASGAGIAAAGDLPGLAQMQHPKDAEEGFLISFEELPVRGR